MSSGCVIQNLGSNRVTKTLTSRRSESESETRTKRRRARRRRPRAQRRRAPMAGVQKPAKRLGGMAEALSIAADLGFPAPPAQVDPDSRIPFLASLIRLFARILDLFWFPVSDCGFGRSRSARLGLQRVSLEVIVVGFGSLRL